MHRKGHITSKIISERNYEDASDGFAYGKWSRASIKAFNERLDEEYKNFVESFTSKTWRPQPYTEKEVLVPKRRIVHKAEVKDHVAEWAAMLPVEPWIFSTFYYRSPSCVPEKGTHHFVRQEIHELRTCSQEEVYYIVQLDIHHYFYWIDHELMKKTVRGKIKDPCLLAFIDRFIDSYSMGLVLGVKLSQTLSGMFLAPFDRLAVRVFDILKDPERFHYWQDRYVTDKLLTCRSREQAEELAKGVQFLNGRFEQFCREGLKHYSRFADNIVIKHQDKTFLHLVTELAIMVLARDYKLMVNRSWNVHPTWMGNDLCGYVFFHEYTLLRKRNKKGLVKKVAKLRKRGLTKEEIRLQVASRNGFAIHCDSKHLLMTLDINMAKRLGTLVKNRRRKAPFEGMTTEQKRPIEQIVCMGNEKEDEKFIQLLDYKVSDSVIEKNEDGTPKLCIAIRYKCIDHIEKEEGEEPRYVWETDEWYSFSGSKVMIDQAQNDFSKEDLPIPTVVKEFVNKQRKKFYKFT